MKKRLIDIMPPRTVEEEPMENAATPEQQPRRPMPKIALAGILIACFAFPPLFSHVFFARATLQIWPQMSQLHMQEYAIAQVGYDGINLEKKIIRARMFEKDAEQTERFPASGSKFKEERAHGTIRVYNEYSAQPQTLVANTRFISEDGKIFRSETSVTIPGGRIDGRRIVGSFADISVIAAEIGEEYNIGPSNFSLPGLVGSPSYTKIYGESTEPMSGGARREVAVVTEEDIAAAKDQLVEDLKAEGIQHLLADVPPAFQVLQDSLNFEILEDTALAKSGTELSEFTYRAKIRISMVAFHREDADVLAKHLLSTYAGPEQMLHEKTLSLSYSVGGALSETGALPLQIEARIEQYQRLDGKSFRKRMKGLSASQFRQAVSEYPFLVKTQISLWPFWLSVVPKDEERIKFKVVLDD